MFRILDELRQLGQDGTGVTALEYALIAGAIAVVMVAGATTFGGNLSAEFTTLASTV